MNRIGIVERYIVFKTSGSIKTHINEHRNAYWLSTKCVLDSDQSSVSSWLVQQIKELPSAAGLCAGRGCALIRQLANKVTMMILFWATP